MSTDRAPRFVIRWHGMYLTGTNKLTHEAVFSWAPVGAKTFPTQEAAQAVVDAIPRAPTGAVQFEHGYEIIDDPVHDR